MWEPIITFILLLISLMIFLIRLSVLPNYCRLIALICVCHIVFYSFTAYLMFNKINNMILFHTMRPIQYALTGLFFFDVLKNKLVKKLVTISIPLYVFTSIGISLTIQNVNTYNSYGIILYNILIILFCLWFFHELLAGSEIKNLFSFPAFWVVNGLLFYCVGTTLSEGLMNFLILNYREYALSFYFIGIILSFVLYGCIITAFVSDLIFRHKSK